MLLIIANGELPQPDWLRPYLARATAVIAADGGANHLTPLGYTPHVLIGDLDSVTAELVAELQGKGTAVFPHPTDKNETDLELALHHAITHYPPKKFGWRGCWAADWTKPWPIFCSSPTPCWRGGRCGW
jgi:thiamine pyrophosphokinase